MSFPLDRKGPKDQGRHQGPAALGERPSPMSAMANAPNPDEVWHTRFGHFYSLVHAGSAEHVIPAFLPMSSPRGNMRGIGSMGRKPVGSMLC